jgi:ubiquitin carboxyl-terminal hydrolase 40
LITLLFTDEGWHLRKTNWCGEAAEVLNDLKMALDDCRVYDGDSLILERGRLPPKVGDVTQAQ